MVAAVGLGTPPRPERRGGPRLLAHPLQGAPLHGGGRGDRGDRDAPALRSRRDRPAGEVRGPDVPRGGALDLRRAALQRLHQQVHDRERRGAGATRSGSSSSSSSPSVGTFLSVGLKLPWFAFFGDRSRRAHGASAPGEPARRDGDRRRALPPVRRVPGSPLTGGCRSKRNTTPTPSTMWPRRSRSSSAPGSSSRCSSAGSPRRPRITLDADWLYRVPGRRLAGAFGEALAAVEPVARLVRSAALTRAGGALARLAAGSAPRSGFAFRSPIGWTVFFAGAGARRPRLAPRRRLTHPGRVPGRANTVRLIPVASADGVAGSTKRRPRVRGPSAAVGFSSPWKESPACAPLREGNRNPPRFGDAGHSSHGQVGESAPRPPGGWGSPSFRERIPMRGALSTG